MEYLVATLSQGLGTTRASRASQPEKGDVSSEAQLAKRNKLFLAFGRYLPADDVNPALRGHLNMEAARVSVNTSMLLTMAVRVSRALHEASVKHVIFKGPLQQKILYDTYFFKPSSDIDILVAARDFRKAREVLAPVGFDLPAECDRLWWSHFLGEQHLVRADGGLLTLDLHHKVQQPGCPSPRQIERFLDDPHHLTLSDHAVPTLGFAKIALLAAMNLVKAVNNSEPAGSYAFDLTAVIQKMDAAELDDLRDEARRQGLLRTLACACSASAATFGMNEQFLATLPCSEDLTYSAARVLSPSQGRTPLGERFRQLKALCDRPKWDFAREAAKLTFSESARMFD